MRLAAPTTKMSTGNLKRPKSSAAAVSPQELSFVKEMTRLLAVVGLQNSRLDSFMGHKTFERYRILVVVNIAGSSVATA